MKKILFYEGVKKRDIFEGEVVRKVEEYWKIKKFLDDGSWIFIWRDKEDIHVLTEFED